MNIEISVVYICFLISTPHLPSRFTTADNCQGIVMDSIAPEMSNGTDQMQPPPENTANPAESKSNGTYQVQPPPGNTANPAESKSRKRLTPGDDNWLPPDWRTEVRVRTSGTKAGVVDKFYYEPVTNRKFRSRNEVLYYLENGTPKKKGTRKTENGEMSYEQSEGRRNSKRQTKSNNKANEPPPPPMPLNFDFLNVPEKVIWTGTNGSEKAWWPSIGDYKIQESVSRDWDRAFTFVTAQNDGKTMF